jgi:hypothetical protein
VRPISQAGRVRATNNESAARYKIRMTTDGFIDTSDASRDTNDEGIINPAHRGGYQQKEAV